MADKDSMPEVISFTKTWHSHPYPFISPSRPELSAAGKNVVVTGGGTGIGNAIAIAFAKAGAKSVSILGRREDKLKSGVASILAAGSQDTEVLYQAADLLTLSETQAAFKSIVDKVGKIDVLVSNAGTLPEPGPIAGYDSEKFIRGITDGIMSTFNTFQAFLPHAGPQPIFLNTSSCMAHIAPTPGMGAYSVSKAAALKMVDFIAAENPKLHVVNVQPGWVPTDLNGHQKEATDSVELPGQFYVWLASPEAEFLKGKFVWANWDAQELMQKAEEIKSSKLLTWNLSGVAM